jgi:hypothetical protein
MVMSGIDYDECLFGIAYLQTCKWTPIAADFLQIFLLIAALPV